MGVELLCRRNVPIARGQMPHLCPRFATCAFTLAGRHQIFELRISINDADRFRRQRSNGPLASAARMIGSLFRRELTSGAEHIHAHRPSTLQRKSAALACGRRGPSSPTIGLACEVEAPCRVSVMHEPTRVRGHGEVRSARVAAAFYGVIPSTPRSRGRVAVLASVARDFRARRETSHASIRVATRHLDGQLAPAGLRVA